MGSFFLDTYTYSNYLSVVTVGGDIYIVLDSAAIARLVARRFSGAEKRPTS